jgi:ATP synthase protein I
MKGHSDKPQANENKHSANSDAPHLAKQVDAKVALKLKAKRQKNAGVWFGLGMMGTIGWSIAIPTLIGVGIGIWLDKQYADPRSWTLALLLAGLAVGCFTAWAWISKEYAAMHEDAAMQKHDNEDNDQHDV